MENSQQRNIVIINKFSLGLHSMQPAEEDKDIEDPAKLKSK